MDSFYRIKKLNFNIENKSIKLTTPRSNNIWHLFKQSELLANSSSTLFASWICWGEFAFYNCSHSFSSSSISNEFEDVVVVPDDDVLEDIA